MIANRGELNFDKAREFFTKHGVRLTLTTAYNPEANGKIERGHSPIATWTVLPWKEEMSREELLAV